MMITILIITGIYFLLSYGAYLQSAKRCKTEQDKAGLKAFKTKLYLNWISYSVTIGKLRQLIKNVKKEEQNTIEQSYQGDPDKITIELFSSCFQGTEKIGSAIFAQYIVNPIADEK